jgi:hypothetical protein
MVVLPLSRFPNDDDADLNPQRSVPAPEADSMNWVRIASAATLIASGALLLSGRRRPALVAAATGTALAMLDQKDIMHKWWLLLPAYIGDVQRLLTEAEGAVEELATQRDKLGKVLGR